MSGSLTMRCGTWQMETKWSLKIFISCPHIKLFLKREKTICYFQKFWSFGNLNLKVIFITMKMTTLVNWKSNFTKYKFSNTSRGTPLKGSILQSSSEACPAQSQNVRFKNLFDMNRRFPRLHTVLQPSGGSALHNIWLPFAKLKLNKTCNKSALI